MEHIHRFQRDFPNATVVKLEQNYRSTATILNAANAVIANNADRMGKNLWTEGAEGEPIRVYAAYNERDEADFVIGRLRDWINQGNALPEKTVELLAEHVRLTESLLSRLGIAVSAGDAADADLTAATHIYLTWTGYKQMTRDRVVEHLRNATAGTVFIPDLGSSIAASSDGLTV